MRLVIHPSIYPNNAFKESYNKLAALKIVLQNFWATFACSKYKRFVLKVRNSLLAAVLLRQSTATSSNIVPSLSLKFNITLTLRHISSADNTSLLNNHTFSYFGMSERKLTPSFIKYNGEAAE